MYLHWSRARWKCEESEYGWQAVTVCCSVMQPPTTEPLCSAAFRATPPPRPASFPLHSEFSVSSSLLLAKEMADIDRAYLGSKLQPNHLRSKMLFWIYLSSQHFSNFVSSSRCPHIVSSNMWAESATLGTTIHHDTLGVLKVQSISTLTSVAADLLETQPMR